MTEEKLTYDVNTILFSQLVLSFQASAMQQLGKIMNPFTQKIERDLPQAKMSIDMLAMIEEKTKGNLTDEEARLLSRALFELRMNYVDEVEKEKVKAQEEKGKEGEKTEEKTEEITKEPESKDDEGQRQAAEEAAEATVEKKDVEKETKKTKTKTKTKKASAKAKEKTGSARKNDTV
jgi:hypothetical protein